MIRIGFNPALAGLNRPARAYYPRKSEIGWGISRKEEIEALIKDAIECIQGLQDSLYEAQEKGDY
jgi:hypothetical protein